MSFIWDYLNILLCFSSDKKELVLVKFMKGSPEFRESSKSYTQFANEVFLYAELLPAYEQLLRGSKLETFVVDEFVPRAYCAKFGVVQGKWSTPALCHQIYYNSLSPLYFAQASVRIASLCWRCNI